MLTMAADPSYRLMPGPPCFPTPQENLAMMVSLIKLVLTVGNYDPARDRRLPEEPKIFLLY